MVDHRLGISTKALHTSPPNKLTAPAVSGAAADPDGDGLPNLLEYALAGDPLAANSNDQSPKAGIDSLDRPTLTYFEASGRADQVHRVEWSRDLDS